VGKIEKLFDKVKNNHQNVRYNDICKLAEAFGFKYKGGKGSHTVYSQKGIQEILNFQNVNGMVKPYQVRQFLRIIEEHGLKLKEE
jgi:hypothetical protein